MHGIFVTCHLVYIVNFGLVGAQVPGESFGQFYFRNLLEKSSIFLDLLLIDPDVPGDQLGFDLVEDGLRIVGLLFLFEEELCSVAFHECSHLS